MSGDQLDLDAIVCNHRWDDGGEPVCERHGFLWPDGEDYCNGFDQSERALVAEVRRLRALVVVDDDSHPAFQPPSDHAGYFVESP